MNWQEIAEARQERIIELWEGIDELRLGLYMLLYCPDNKSADTADKLIRKYWSD